MTKSWTEGFLERPRMDKELLRTHSRGLIALLPSFAGDVAQLLRAGDPNGAAAALAEFKNILGAENVFLEITHHPKVAGHEMLDAKDYSARARERYAACCPKRRLLSGARRPRGDRDYASHPAGRARQK